MKQQVLNHEGKVTFEWDSKNIYSVIELIKLKPWAVLGNHANTIAHLDIYLSGYQQALGSLNLMDKGTPRFSHFSTWLCGCRKERALEADWYYHILRMAKKNQKKAFNLFFDLIDEYKKSPILAQEITITENSKASKTKKILFYSIRVHFNGNATPLPHKIVIFQIGKSDSRWTVFYNAEGIPYYDSFTDKSKEVYKAGKAEFGIKKNEWNQLNNTDSLKLYKTTFSLI
jgi:hypothetical protein